MSQTRTTDRPVNNSFGLQLTPIGRVRTSWARGDCPKNMRAARESGRGAQLLIDAPWRAGLAGIGRASHLIALGWFAGVDRGALVQQPKHLAEPQGCFSLRTPARPNPLGVSVVRVVALDLEAGRIDVDALDWFDGTGLIDIKPYYASVDAYADAIVQEPTPTDGQKHK